MSQLYTGTNLGKAGLEMTEVDGVPDVNGVSKITVSNGTLTDDGNGDVTLTTGGGGGGGVTTLAFGTTGLTTAGAISGVIAVAGTFSCSQRRHRSHNTYRWRSFIGVRNRSHHSPCTTY